MFFFKFKEMDKLHKKTENQMYRIRKKIAGSSDKPRLSVFWKQQRNLCAADRR